MNNFLGRLFGKKTEIATGTAETARALETTKAHTDEHAELRAERLRSALDEYLRRPATDREFDSVTRIMTDPQSGSLEQFSREEMLQRIADNAARLQLRQGSEIHVVNGQEYTPRGNRESNFEAGLARALGKDLTNEDREAAYAYIRDTEGEEEKFKKMVGEEVSHYAETVARRMLVQRLREESRDDVSSSDQRMAAK